MAGRLLAENLQRYDNEESAMYRLMKSVRLVLQHATLGPMSSYRHSLVGHYPRSQAAVGACDTANKRGAYCYYVLNESGQEHYQGSWID